MTQPNQPTVADFQTFLTNIAQIPASALPPGSPIITYAFDYALNICSHWLSYVCSVPGAWSIYQQAVYNLACDTLINWAQDQPGECYFADLRTGYKINSFIAGVVQSASDEGTSAAYLVPETFKNYNIDDLQLLKTPYGRFYLGLASKIGTIWGVS